jgi:hypothetical protein
MSGIFIEGEHQPQIVWPSTLVTSNVTRAPEAKEVSTDVGPVFVYVTTAIFDVAMETRFITRLTGRGE